MKRRDARAKGSKQGTHLSPFAELSALAAAASRTVGPDLDRAATLVAKALQAHNRVLACGNGGSAADASHLVAELVGRFCHDRPGLPAVCLASDGPTLTALANDFGVEALFSRQVEALGRPGDVLCVFSTSGRSPNILAAMSAGKRRGLRVIAFLGERRDPRHRLADVCLRVPSSSTPRIQELHTAYIHAVVAGVEGKLPSLRP